ncbi:HPr kinase/phosphorylase [Cohaesibacter haloalkalitolerans]|uniref:HPr kinase/phosphorylase n=1 Tax=Cohaesibacter haloalkalitolerans TaxID=1162980 RepID=UPI0013C4BBE4|nr:hypothetical protein [Cohaesibacter haloalkalitolerans]
MSLYFDRHRERTGDGPLFDLPSDLDPDCPRQIMHAAALVIGPHGILLNGESGSGKSLLQRSLRREAQALSINSALVSDDYVQLVCVPAKTEGAWAPSVAAEAGDEAANQVSGEGYQLLAFGPTATRGLQEVRGLGIISVGPGRFVDHAPMHLLVDLCDPNDIERMPSREQRTRTCLDQPIAHLSVPRHSVVEAMDMIFALLSTWKEPL